MSTILLIDDEPDITAPIARYFERASHRVEVAHNADEGLAAFHRVRPDLVMLDVGLPDASGLEVLDRLAEERAVAIMLTGRADVATVVEAMRRGAENFVTKPVELRQLREIADRALEKASARGDARPAAAPHAAPVDGLDWRPILGVSSAMRAIADQIALVARSERTAALIVGEPGTRASRVAEMVHASSPRASRPFIHVDCASLSADALDVELFGRVAAPGAEARPGLVEAADGATLFLEEVAALDAALQAKLLRVLEGRSVRRAGAVEEFTATPRVIASTRKDLATEVSMKRFREDLYYRLAVMPTSLPPLRARAREDVVALITATVEQAAESIGGAPTSLSEGALERMARYAWPGNLDELWQVVERSLLVARGAPELRSGHLPPEIRVEKGGMTSGAAEPYVPRSLADVERDHVDRTLRAHRWNRTRAAEQLGISRATLIKKIREYGIEAG